MTEEERKDVTANTDANAAEEDATVMPTDDSSPPLDEGEAQLTMLEEKLAQAEASLAEAEKLAAEYRDGWQRAQASFVNFRKRTESEHAKVQAEANARLLARIVPVLDDFKRAFEAVPEEYQDNAWVKGVRLVERKLKSVLDSENVKPIEVNPKDAFDPNFHQAVLYQEVAGFGEGEIVAEIETGYLLGDQILRPSLVVVAKGHAAVAAEDVAPDNEVEAGGDAGDTESVAGD